MLPSVTLDASLRVIGYNEAFVGNIIPEKMTLGYKILSLFDESDRHEAENAIKSCELEQSGLTVLHKKHLTTTKNQPDALPIRSEYDCIVTHATGKFTMVIVHSHDSSFSSRSSHEADELRDFFNKAPIALHWLSDEGKVLWANDRELEVLGYSRGEYIGEDIMKFCPDSKDTVLEIFKQLGSGRTIRDVPVRFRTKSGKVQDLLIDSNVNYKDDGSFNHTRCFIRDDTGRKIREARVEIQLLEAKRLAKEKGRFVSKLLHEIKTPLHVMSMAMNLGEHIDVIDSQVDHLSRLVSNMSSAMRFDDGNTPSEHMVECDLAQFFETYTKPSFFTKSSAVDMISDLKNGDELVMIDSVKLSVVLDELLIFCDQVSDDGGRLKVRVTKTVHHGEYLIKVSCVGRVLDKASIQKVFHSYWLDSSSTSKPLHTDTPGLNLGLNIAFNNVQLMGSDLAMESTVENTCFSFRLNPLTSKREHNPITVPPVETIVDIAQNSQCIGLNDSMSRHILLVEDNTICQKMCKRLLTKLGHTCNIADNGAIAVDMVTGPECMIYDAVLMDIRMPIMDGIEATTKITEYLAHHRTKLPIIALTAEDDFDITRAENNVGFWSVLKKPASISNIEKELAACWATAEEYS